MSRTSEKTVTSEHVYYVPLVYTAHAQREFVVREEERTSTGTAGAIRVLSIVTACPKGAPAESR